jgi:hypothetical protein
MEKLNMIDPDNILFNAQVKLNLPRVITAPDHQNLGHFQDFLRDLGLDVYVTEVGFNAPHRVAVVHMDTPSHNQTVLELDQYYNSLDQSE